MSNRPTSRSVFSALSFPQQGYSDQGVFGNLCCHPILDTAANAFDGIGLIWKVFRGKATLGPA